MSEKPWEGRFTEKTDRLVESFTASIDVDRQLYADDIDGSVAHCRMLARAGIITAEEAAQLVEGLGRIRREIERGNFRYDDSLEDIHMHIEARLVQEVGTVAQKLHTARSRNDQVVLDARLYLRREVREIAAHLAELRRVLTDLAEAHLDVILPGYTHLQRAQPVLLAHHWLAYCEMFTRDSDRLAEAYARINVLPLGAAALAGTTYPIDRAYTAELLGFAAVSANSLDTVGDRDFMLEFLAAASICMMHLSRLSEELVLWSSAEFGFIGLPDAFATGSSIMPQKKNPDVPELVRGKTGRVYGALVALLTTMKGLPLAYNRDMQEDKGPLFDAVTTLKGCLGIYIRMLPKLAINAEAMGQAAATGFLNATDLADYLVTRGLPFRKAHGCAGQAVGYAVSVKKELHELSLAELQRFSPLIKADIFEALATRQMVDRRRSLGGTATENVKAALAVARQQLEEDRRRWTPAS
ncbi:MAG: argininosuccinate lyase [Desulfobacteraceae bacterium]|nr:argininosuccinate lyase [Desulfobacteraceae bacterium]